MGHLVGSGLPKDFGLQRFWLRWVRLAFFRYVEITAFDTDTFVEESRHSVALDMFLDTVRIALLLIYKYIYFVL